MTLLALLVKYYTYNSHLYQLNHTIIRQPDTAQLNLNTRIAKLIQSM